MAGQITFDCLPDSNTDPVDPDSVKANFAVTCNCINIASCSDWHSRTDKSC